MKESVREPPAELQEDEYLLAFFQCLASSADCAKTTSTPHQPTHRRAHTIILTAENSQMHEMATCAGKAQSLC